MENPINITGADSPSSSNLERDVHLTPLAGAKCVHCGSTKVFLSRSKLTDLPFQILGFELCRCGQCLTRFRRWKFSS